MRVRTRGSKRGFGLRLIAGIAIYGLILHSLLSAFHSPPTLAQNLALDLHAMCLSGADTGTDHPDQAPAKHPDGFCPICVRLAGLQLGPPPQDVVIARVAPQRSIRLFGESDRDVAARPAVRPHSRGPPAVMA